MAPVIVTIDGNIGTGKSTVMRVLCETYPNLFISHQEPVSGWEPFLQSLYEEDRGHFAFQAKVWRDCCTKDLVRGEGLHIVERSPAMRRHVFLAPLVDHHDIRNHELALLNEMYSDVMSFRTDVRVYLRSNPAACLERVKKRGRTSESRIRFQYLEQIHKRHEDAVAAAVASEENIIILDVENRSPEELATELYCKLQQAHIV